MRIPDFANNTLADIKDLLKEDPKIGDRLKRLIEECCLTPFVGIGKPEPLRGKDFRDIWSRRISDKHRLVYKVSEDKITILSCKGHYKDK